ncbi:MAG: hypothetical protein NVS3B3_19920 [Aquirhabdus sp.]
MKDIGKLLLGIYHAARELPLEEFQEFALVQLQKSVDFDLARWETSDEYFSAEVSLINGLQTPYYSLQQPDNLPAIRQPTLFMINQTTSALQAYAERSHLEHELVITTKSTGSNLIKVIALYRTHDKQAFSRKEREFGQSVVPHLIEAWAINHLAHLDRMRTLLEGSGWSMAIVDSAGHLLFADNDFKSLLYTEWPIAGHTSIPQRLSQIITNQKSGWYVGNAIVISPMPTKGLFFLRSRLRLPIDCLTIREREVAKLVAQGFTYKEIAIKLKIAPATVRNHIHSILVNANEHNIIELATQLRAAGY